MKRMFSRLVLFNILILSLVLQAGLPGIALAQTDLPDSGQEQTPIPPTAVQEPEESKPPQNQTVTPEFQPTFTPTATQSIDVIDEAIDSLSSPALFTIEGPVTQWVSELAERYGWDQIFFLGLSLEDWINLALSVLIFILIYIAGRWLINQGLRQLLRRAAIETAEEFLDVIKPQVSWFVIIFALQISLARLAFLSEGLRILLLQVFFIAYLTIITIILWKAIDFGADALLKHNRTAEDIKRLGPIYLVAKRLLEALLLVVYASIALSYFGIDITAFAASLGIAGLAISLAAQDTLADAIAGFLILIDQPFRVGDRIEISGLGTWGDVVEIGTRSTRIRTRDNRLVIVPNSAIAKDQVVNYTYPDPRYRVQIEVGIDYDSDLRRAREAAIKAVQQVEGVLPDKPVDALFVDFGDATITFRIRWWIESFIDTRRMFDKVNEALLKGFNEANINMPNMTYDLNLKVDEQNVRQFSEAVQKDPPDSKSGQSSAQE
jgi:small-conductance mechanosensitive channel